MESQGVLLVMIWGWGWVDALCEYHDYCLLILVPLTQEIEKDNKTIY